MEQNSIYLENKTEIETLLEFLKFPISSTKEIFAKLKTIEGHIFRENDPEGKQRFLYFEGKRENKVLLVAHADTYIHKLKNKLSDIHIVTIDSSNADIIRATDENGNTQLLGADDRAGIAILWLLKETGHSILVTDGEEDGRLGSFWLMEENPDIADMINENHQFFIQLDRRNNNDFKCYDVGTDEFRKFIKDQTGYREPNRLYYTDIVTLCRDICGVNFSIGYYNEHSENETLVVSEWLNTLNMIKKMLSMEYLPKFEL